MLKLFIHLNNSEFASRDEGANYERPEAALAQGVHSAAILVGEEISQGKHSAAILVSIEQEDGIQILRSVVAICVSPLLSFTKRPEAIFDDSELPVTGR